MSNEQKPGAKPEAEQSKGEPKDVHGHGSGPHQPYQRGGSGSEGGTAEEENHGSDGDLSKRGGGTGMRETEKWGNRPADQQDEKEKKN